jgi:hypothetical protein
MLDQPERQAQFLEHRFHLGLGHNLWHLATNVDEGHALDQRDLDLGGTAPLPLTIGNQAFILALGKDGRLGVKFPGPTRQSATPQHVRAGGSYSRKQSFRLL